MEKNRKIRIGVIKADGIGDAVLASPFFFGLRQHYKHAHITAFLSPAGKEALEGLGLFDKIEVINPLWLSYEKKSLFERWGSALSVLKHVNKHHFDTLISLRWQDRLSSLILSFSNARDKYGYDVNGAGFGINRKMASPKRNIHETEKHILFLQRITGKKYPVKLGFALSKQSEENITRLLKKGEVEKFAVLHPVSGHSSKDWGIDNYRNLAAMLAKKINVVVVGNKTDGDIMSIKGKNIVNLSGIITVREMGSLIKRAQIVIGNDSAAVHIASAFNVKSLTVFSGAADYKEWGALGKNSYIVTKDVPCAKCQQAECDRGKICLEIPPEFIHSIADRILKNKQKHNIIQYVKEDELF
ncbi:MAG: hypothetical protein CVV21_10475 [Candidatus Goldiibacteriota bacterium HGW-Goldbacteria-1]|jgi:heptosyltransferase-3|nr:MAG: hypothetical protein CVV21_10475 [Candidatus Goldiibacteriota bacterium HGW-Goldbacteria-1]